VNEPSRIGGDDSGGVPIYNIRARRNVPLLGGGTMRLLIAMAGMIIPLLALQGGTMADFTSDRFPTSAGELEITFIGHGTLMAAWNGRIVHIDPVSAEADYGRMPKADLILVTHEHPDHLDPAAIAAVRKPETLLIYTAACSRKDPGGRILGNGETLTAAGIGIEAVPAYNILRERAPGLPFHPKGVGNGYVLTFGNLRVYVAGDTEGIPEMKNLKQIDIAFLPMNLPYTMKPEEAAAAARSFQPKILYPYHYGDTDPTRLPGLLEGSGIEVRIRGLK
jgi:L-ascorbate metabolism protein UlaG (beta-lactamase superfamily)